jgi:hypothetical protein
MRDRAAPQHAHTRAVHQCHLGSSFRLPLETPMATLELRWRCGHDSCGRRLGRRGQPSRGRAKKTGAGGRAAGTELVRATGRPVRRAIDEVLLGDVRVTSAAEGRRMLAGEEETVEALWRVIAAARPPRKPRLASVCVLCWLIRPRPQQPDAVARRRRQREQPRQSRNGRLRLVRTRNGANRPRTGLGSGRAGASSAVRPQGALRAGG